MGNLRHRPAYPPGLDIASPRVERDGISRENHLDFGAMRKDQGHDRGVITTSRHPASNQLASVRPSEGILHRSAAKGGRALEELSLPQTNGGYGRGQRAPALGGNRAFASPQAAKGAEISPRIQVYAETTRGGAMPSISSSTQKQQVNNNINYNRMQGNTGPMQGNSTFRQSVQIGVEHDFGAEEAAAQFRSPSFRNTKLATTI